jgi:hypothetical protein
MTRSPPPSPESDAVQVVDVLVDPEIVQTGEPPFLKCGLAAVAVVAVAAASATMAVTAMSVLRIRASDGDPCHPFAGSCSPAPAGAGRILFL